MAPNDKQLRDQLAAIKKFKQTCGVGDKKLITSFFKKGVYNEREKKEDPSKFYALPPYNPENS